MDLNLKPVKEITEANIKYLLENKISESVNLDYKRDLPGGEDSEKKDFLADVTAFANTNGGVIIYGIEEEKNAKNENTGLPKSIFGIDSDSIDKTKLRLQNIIQSGIDPHIPAIDMGTVEVEDIGVKKYVLILRIPRSLFSPHIIWFQKSGKFYKRNNTSNYQMDVREIKNSFLERDSWETRADNFRRTRIMEVRSQGNFPGAEKDGSYFIHILPLGDLDGQIYFEQYQAELQAKFDPFFGGRSFISRFNFDGLLLNPVAQPYEAFIQFFRKGGLELFSSKFNTIANLTPPRKIIYGDECQKAIEVNIERFLKYFPKFGIDSPLVVFLSWLGIKNIALVVGKMNYGRREDPFAHTFDRNDILFPGIIIDKYDCNVSEVLRPTFSCFWQSAGWPDIPL